MSTFTVRDATEEDAELLQRFMARLVSERLPVLWERDEPPSVEQEREFVRGVLDVPGSVILIAMSGPRAIGILDFHRDRALLKELIARAQDKGIERLELEVFESNAAAIRLYQHMGFQEEGRRRGAVRVAGTKIDILIMGMDLTT
jgi:GNAT superfamily N-acetyltransferase